MASYYFHQYQLEIILAYSRATLFDMSYELVSCRTYGTTRRLHYDWSEDMIGREWSRVYLFIHSFHRFYVTHAITCRCSRGAVGVDCWPEVIRQPTDVPRQVRRTLNSHSQKTADRLAGASDRWSKSCGALSIIKITVDMQTGELWVFVRLRASSCRDCRLKTLIRINCSEMSVLHRYQT